MFEIVVRAEDGEGTRSDAVAEEDLRGSVDPRTRCQQKMPFGSDVVEESRAGSVQGHCPHQQHRQDDVWKQRREPNYLPYCS